MKIPILLMVFRLASSFYNTSTCAVSQYLDTLTLTCKDCPSNTRVEQKTQQSCVCNNNFRKTDPYSIGFTTACTQCSGVYEFLNNRRLHLTEQPVKAVQMGIMLILGNVRVHLAKQSSVMAWMDHYCQRNSVLPVFRTLTKALSLQQSLNASLALTRE